ncbi:Dolichyl-diphosphooligosaccharide--protein glycosyltransferase subunit 1A, partial [Ananas comosus]
IDLTSHIVRVLSSLKIENAGPDAVSEVLFAFPNMQAKNLAAIKTFYSEGKGKGKSPSIALPTVIVQREGMPPELTFYSVALPKSLEKGKTLNMDMLAVFAHSLTPFPEEITQADVQLLVSQDSAYYLSPYAVKVQSLGIRLPNGRVESYTKYPNTKLVDWELKYGPFESLPPFSYSPIIVHFENNHPFAITEHYTIVHGGARTKGGFSRIDYQMRTNIRGTSSFSLLTALLPPRAHSIYYRDEIGNISTSTLWADSRETQFGIQPRFPIFGGWRTTFTIGYSLPLQDFLFESDGKRVLNITYGCPIQEAVADKLIMKRVMEKDAAMTEDVVAYNIIPLDSPSITNAIVSFPEVRAAVSALQYYRGLPKLPSNFPIPVARNADMLDFLHYVFGFQDDVVYYDGEYGRKDNVGNQREHVVHLLANEQSRLGKVLGIEP